MMKVAPDLSGPGIGGHLRREDDHVVLPDLTYTAQFEVLRVWIGTLEPAELAEPSVLAGWTVADLVGHLAGTGLSIAALRPAEHNTPPISIAAYVSKYAAATDEIAETARQTTANAGRDLLAALDEAHRRAQSNLDSLGAGDRVVVARRGPILLSDFLDTRLIELVVHSFDLTESVPDRSGPMLLPSAERRVVTVLRELLTEHASNPVEALAAASALPNADFIQLAAGRVRPSADFPPALSEAIPLF